MFVDCGLRRCGVRKVVNYNRSGNLGEVEPMIRPSGDLIPAGVPYCLRNSLPCHYFTTFEPSRIGTGTERSVPGLDAD